MDMRGESGEVGRVFREMVTALRDADLITENCFVSIVSRDLPDIAAFEQASFDLVDAITSRDYYKLLERIEKGEKLIAGEVDPKQKAGYEKLLVRLLTELEGFRK